MVTKDPGLVVIAKRIMPANDLKELIAWMRANPGKGSLGHTGRRQPGTCGQHPLSEADQHQHTGRALSQCRPSHAGRNCRAPRYDVYQPVHCPGADKVRQHQGLRRDGARPFGGSARDFPPWTKRDCQTSTIAGWHAYWAPKDTSHDVIERLYGAILNALANFTVRKRIIDSGCWSPASSGRRRGALAALQRAEIGNGLPLLKEAGINPISPATD